MAMEDGSEGILVWYIGILNRIKGTVENFGLNTLKTLKNLFLGVGFLGSDPCFCLKISKSDRLRQ